MGASRRILAIVLALSLGLGGCTTHRADGRGDGLLPGKEVEAWTKEIGTGLAIAAGVALVIWGVPVLIEAWRTDDDSDWEDDPFQHDR